MKAINSIKVIAISAVASLILVGCGGSGSSATGTTTGTTIGTTISGTAIDPEIQGANVYLDANGNGKYDANELNTTTDNLGRYSLTIPKEDIGKTIIVEGGIDRVTKADFKGKLKLISRADSSGQFATPLTTMVKEYKDANPTKTLSEVRDELATKLGLASTSDLDKDTLKDKNLLKVALRLQKVAQKVSDASGKDISSVYKRIADKLSGTNADLDKAMQDTIDADVNKTSLDYDRAMDLDRELKRVNYSSLSSEELAMTVENIDNNITYSKTKQELNVDIYNHSDVVVSTPARVKEMQDKKVLERLGFKDLSNTVKQKIINNNKLDFKNGLISDIKDKITKNSIGLDSNDMKEIDREKLFNISGLSSMRPDVKKQIQDKLGNENFDFTKASKADFEQKLQDSNFMSGLSSSAATELKDKLSTIDPTLSSVASSTTSTTSTQTGSGETTSTESTTESTTSTSTSTI